MLQNASLCILFCLISYILARMALKSEIAFLPEMAFSQKWLSDRNCSLAKNTFVKFEVAFWLDMAFWLEMTFQMNLPYFSKY